MSQFDRGVGTYWPTVCSDPRCTTTQTCQREKHERYGNAPGENYGPRCVPLPPPARTAEEERADVLAFIATALMPKYGRAGLSVYLAVMGLITIFAVLAAVETARTI